MTDSYSQRKWAGMPHTEQKRLPPEEPSRLAPRKPGGHRERITTTHIYRLLSKDSNEFWDFRHSTYCPFTGITTNTFARERAADHVIKRLKGYLLTDKRFGIYWVEDQANRKQVTPEFSNPTCLVNWLIYEGVKRGYLQVHSFINWEKHKCWRWERV